ncbi:MAG: hypothetical protein U9N85_08635 [Bacteroidota bacterium]|nr:hypothetical protein [Bacteroidota bacterium]
MKFFKNYIAILLVLFTVSAFAQEQISYPAINAKTYELFLQKDWKQLIKTGKQSLKKDIDFYYLQVRMGIAYYELKKYPKAVKHFENAHDKNKTDELIQEYLYFSYLFSGRYEDARVMAGTFKRLLKKKLNISAEHPFISALYIETKHDFNEDYKYAPQLGESVSQRAVLNQSYYNLSLEHKIGDRVTIFHGYSHIGITNGVVGNAIDLPPFYTEYINQNEYYFSLKLQAARGLNLSGAFHYLNTNYYAPDLISSSGGGRWGVSFPLYDYSENTFVGAINLSKHFSIVRIAGGTSFSNLNQNLQIQPEVSVKLYPFGNSKFFTESQAVYLWEDDGISISQNPVFKQSIGVSFLTYSWFIPSVTYGNLKNYTAYNALIANNDVDIIKQKYEALVNFGFNKGKFNLFFKYQYNLKENQYEVNNTDQYKDYVNQSITGGIKWYFNKY